MRKEKVIEIQYSGFQELRRLRELHARLGWPRVHRPEIVLYTPNQLRQLIRSEDVCTFCNLPGAVRPFAQARKRKRIVIYDMTLRITI